MDKAQRKRERRLLWLGLSDCRSYRTFAVHATGVKRKNSIFRESKRHREKGMGVIASGSCLLHITQRSKQASKREKKGRYQTSKQASKQATHKTHLITATKLYVHLAKILSHANTPYTPRTRFRHPMHDE